MFELQSYFECLCKPSKEIHDISQPRLILDLHCQLYHISLSRFLCISKFMTPDKIKYILHQVRSEFRWFFI